MTVRGRSSMSSSAMPRLPLLSLSLVLLLLLSLFTPSHSIPDVTFVLNADSSATIRVNGLTWLRTDATWLHAHNTTFSTANRTLTLSSTKQHLGRDSLGSYNATTLTWTTPPSSPLLRPLSPTPHLPHHLPRLLPPLRSHHHPIYRLRTALALGRTRHLRPQPRRRPLLLPLLPTQGRRHPPGRRPVV